MTDAIKLEHPIVVTWQGDRRYSGGPPDSPALTLDGNGTIAPSPVDAVLIALGSCSAVDVVDILAKRRTPATSLEVRLDFKRAAQPPRRLTAVHLSFRIATESARNHVERAVKLSFDKYCSVATSLAADLEVTWDVELTDVEGDANGAKS